mgnify:CR=1 FL=1
MRFELSVSPPIRILLHLSFLWPLLLYRAYRYRDGWIRCHVVVLLLLLLLLEEHVWLWLEHKAIWGLVLLLPLLPKLVLISIIPSHIVLTIHHLVLKLLLLLLLNKLLLHVPLLLPEWIVNVLESTKSYWVVVFVYVEILGGVALAVLVFFLLETFQHLRLVFEFRRYSVDLLVFEPKLLRALHLDTTTGHVLIWVHHHGSLEPWHPIIFEFDCELFLWIWNIVLVKIIVEVVARVLRVVHLLELKLVLVLLIVVLLLLLVKDLLLHLLVHLLLLLLLLDHLKFLLLLWGCEHHLGRMALANDV